MEFRRRRDPHTLAQINQALEQAGAARTGRQRQRALVALAAAQAEFRRRQESALDLELSAMVEGKNWSSARVDMLEERLAAAEAALTKELAT